MQGSKQSSVVGGRESCEGTLALWLWWGWMCIGTGQGCGLLVCRSGGIATKCPAKFLEALIASEFNTNPSALYHLPSRPTEIDHHHTKDISSMR